MKLFEGKSFFEKKFAFEQDVRDGSLELDDGSKVAIIGGGPAGSFFCYFLLDMAERIDLDLDVDIYEMRDFSIPGPTGCNMCGGIISESLVQNLATDRINLPGTVVRRGIDAYVLHMDVGSVKLETPLQEKRIGSVYRGPGPRGITETKWDSFDGHLQAMTKKKGANIISERVDDVVWEDERPQIKTRNGSYKPYDLVVVSVGINSKTLKLFEKMDLGYQIPLSTKTYIREYYLGADTLAECFGNAMHVFLLDIPRLEFAAIIPKGDYASLCLLGEEIDKELLHSFLDAPEVRQCFPPGFELEKASCQCAPRISIKGAAKPFADRIVFIGDSGETRLYKDGIGAAFRTAKSAASTAVFQGVSAEDFKQHYLPTCRKISTDNTIGKVVFQVTSLIQKTQFARRAVLRMVSREQQAKRGLRRMSTVLWDTFTGSAPYKEILFRTFHPAFWGRLLLDLATSIRPFSKNDR